MFDRETLIAHYKRMSDSQFTYLATHEAVGLKPEAIEILKEELRRRGTVPDPDAAIDAQLRGLSSEAFERLIVLFREQPCPLCQRSAGLLNGARVSRGGYPEVVVGCVACLNRLIKQTTELSVGTVMLMLFRPSAVLALQDDTKREALESGAPTQQLREFVWANRGEWAHLLK